MNVLILTPDRVGSSLLQRLVTVYMSAHDYDRPVINIHELSDPALFKYHSAVFNQEVIGRSLELGCYRSLPDTVDLLKSADHYKVCRLTYFYLKQRQDSIADQLPLYHYLNDNYFIISARRDNMFEYGLSWCIAKESHLMNAASHQEKYENFKKLYRNKITVDPQMLLHHIYQYQDYIKWVDESFKVNSYFHYDRDMARIEDYILNLNIFKDQEKKKSWKDIFGISFTDWNKCHYLVSDMSGIGQQLENSAVPKLAFDNKNTSLQLQCVEPKYIPQTLTREDQQLLIDKGPTYTRAVDAIQQLVDHKVLFKAVPIKLQTMMEKQLLINNFDECLEAYNRAIEDPVSTIYHIKKTLSLDDISKISDEEIKRWHTLPKLT
jgi:hypothetical protein